MPDRGPTSGVHELDRLIGGILPGDNLVWEADSGAPVGAFVGGFLSSSIADNVPIVYVSFNCSPQAIAGTYGDIIAVGQFVLVDCFSFGKGKGDEMFLNFFRSSNEDPPFRALHVGNPADSEALAEQLIRIALDEAPSARYVFDSLTGMFDLWGDEETVLRFFGYFCPRLYDLGTVAYWLLEKGAHSERFLAKLQHITQVVLEVALLQGARTLTVKKAKNRECRNVGIPQRFTVGDGQLALAVESREDRELGLLTRLGNAVASALEPSVFFEQTMAVLAEELGMVRVTLVLLDRTSGKLRIAAAYGFSKAECARGEYAIGEGVTGRVVQTGAPEIIPDISEDPRFLDRTAARESTEEHISFICVPVKVDDEVIGALSADRPLATPASLQKDLRLLTIVSSTVSQVLKMNRLISVEKEKVLARNDEALRELGRRYRLDNVVGQSEAIKQVLVTAATAAKSRASILLSGDTGTGKELVANVIHFNSARASGPFLKVNCGALSESLLESELFGHVKGAFTGAVERRKGRFELADGGTLFLDEVGEMSPRLQVKLLRVLQEGEFEPLGGMRTTHVDVRMVAATNKNLETEVREGRFREDLYYRLNVIPVHLPPLRERREDIPLLVDYFLKKYNEENDKKVTKISYQVLDLLLGYSWPGNVRELENCIERAVVMSPSETLSVDLLPYRIRESRSKIKNVSTYGGSSTTEVVEVRRATARACEGTEDLSAVRKVLTATVEKTIIESALAHGLSQRDLARRLGISRMTLQKRIREYGIK